MSIQIAGTAFTFGSLHVAEPFVRAAGLMRPLPLLTIAEYDGEPLCIPTSRACRLWSRVPTGAAGNPGQMSWLLVPSIQQGPDDLTDSCRRSNGGSDPPKDGLRCVSAWQERGGCRRE